jgi:hypothetical protein
MMGEHSVTVARSPIPEGIEEYAGKWVVIRAGEVVAAADSFEELVAVEGLHPDDAIYHVPERDSVFF